MKSTKILFYVFMLIITIIGSFAHVINLENMMLKDSSANVTDFQSFYLAIIEFLIFMYFGYKLISYLAKNNT